jgi:hypothetical protein
MIIKSTTTRIESIARSAARRPRYAPAHPQLFRTRLTTTRGGHIAAVCFRHRSPPDLYFATHRGIDGHSTGALIKLMCNVYSITTNQAAIIALFRVINRYVRNLPPMPGVFPDFPAPVVRNTDTGRELVMMRWGMPPPPRTPGPPVTNIRNTSSPHWRMWLKPNNRCLVPANSLLNTLRRRTR